MELIWRSICKCAIFMVVFVIIVEAFIYLITKFSQFCGQRHTNVNPNLFMRPLNLIGQTVLLRLSVSQLKKAGPATADTVTSLLIGS